MSDCQLSGCNYPEGGCSGECQGVVTQPSGDQAAPTPEQYQAALESMAHRLQTANAIINALIAKSGGEVVLTPEDAAASIGKLVVSDVSECRQYITLRSVAPVVQ